MTRLDDGLYAALIRRGLTRRDFLKFSTAMAAALALPVAYGAQIAAAVEAAPRFPVIWLRGQSCAGNSQAFLGATKPTASELLLDLLSIDYQDSLMAPSGAAATQALADVKAAHPKGYLAIVEGAIPTGADGAYCLVGGRPFADLVREVCAGAIGTIAVGACAVDGGAPAASGGSTGAVGVSTIVPDVPLVSLPGCPLNVENLAATLVHYLTFKQFPVTDGAHRPLFAYGGLIHNQCERRAHFEFGEFAVQWGDEASQKGWCLYKMGCKGPETFANCPTTRYGGGTSWPVKAGHGCIGCHMPHFWDAMGPAYARLPAPLPFLPAISADTLGQLLVGGVGGLTVVHGVGSYVRQRRVGAAERRAAAAGEAGLTTTVEAPIGEAAVAVAEPPAAVEAPTGEAPPASGAPGEPIPAAETVPTASGQGLSEPHEAEEAAPEAPPSAQGTPEAPSAETPPPEVR